jgi:acetyl esterase/lipase
MKTFTLNLDLNYEKLNLGGGHRASMDCFLPDNFDFSAGRKRPAIVIFPGGAYAGCSKREDQPIALRYLAEDFAAFVVQYSTAEDAAFPRCLFEALTAIKTVRENAEEWNIDPEKIAIIGFSAGGHLAASASAYWNSELARNALGDSELMKPNAAILSYPVISSGPWAHQGSIDNLLGPDASEEAKEQVSIEKQVTADFPPSFIWHTATDGLVPAMNSILLAQSLAKANVPYELHIYPLGPHGLSLADERTAKVNHPQYIVPRVIGWVEESLCFLKEAVFNK